METSARNNAGLRWTVLIVTILAIAFCNITQVVPMGGAKSIVQVTYENRSLFVPAGYAFAIWGIIFLGFIIYAIYQVLPSQRNEVLYDRLAYPFMAVNVLNAVWQVLFRFEYIGWALLIIIANFIFGLVQFRIVKPAVNNHHHSQWLTVPFSIFMGWISVATIANISIYCVHIGWHGGPIPEVTLAMITLFIAVLLGVIMSVAYRDWLYPAVVAWATIAISVAYRAEVQDVSDAALLAGIVSAAWSLGMAIRYSRNKQPYHKKFSQK